MKCNGYGCSHMVIVVIVVCLWLMQLCMVITSEKCLFDVSTRLHQDFLITSVRSLCFQFRVCLCVCVFLCASRITEKVSNRSRAAPN